MFEFVEVLAHECDVVRAMAYCSRALRVVDLHERDHYDILATCPPGWDPRQVAIGFPDRISRITAGVVWSVIAARLQGWQVEWWKIGRDPRPGPDDIPYKYGGSSSTRYTGGVDWAKGHGGSGGAFIEFQVDWLPDG